MSVILVCGGRDFNDRRFLFSCLDSLNSRNDIDISMVVAGGAAGADTLARLWAEVNGIHCAEVRALWDIYNRRAGYLRNAAMLELNPIYTVAFPGGPGTAMMVKLCKEKEITVWEPVK